MLVTMDMTTANAHKKDDILGDKDKGDNYYDYDNVDCNGDHDDDVSDDIGDDADDDDYDCDEDENDAVVL